MSQPVIGVLGGSGLYEIEGLSQVEEVELSTPFGAPSDSYLTGVLDDRKLVFLPRHGKGHRISPSEVNYRANIHGFKQLGAQWLLSISAVGSMREEIKPGDVVVIDQLFDRTKNRACSFFGEGVVGHIPFADPMCPDLSQVLYDSAVKAGATVHQGGTYICIEGPQFSTRAESRIYRSWGVDVIGMTNIPEAKLAREAGICYATAALSTDYDCWHETEDDVSVEAVVETLRKNVDRAREIIALTARAITVGRTCQCEHAVKGAVLTEAAAIPPSARERLALILREE